MKRETWSIRFLYQTVPGRFLLKGMTHPWISQAAGTFLDSRFSAWLVPLFIRKHRIDMSEYENVNYSSFNAFFTRKRKSEQIDMIPEHLISPCDAYLSVYPIDEKQSYKIKQIEYRMEALLQNHALAGRFAGGICLIFRLTPKEYHRYCYPCDGTWSGFQKIPGKLHCVRPVAYTSVPVFAENSREYTVMRTTMGATLVQMEIGAMLVGKIHNHPFGGRILRGEEKGYFEFGGSTVMVLIEKDRAEIEKRILENMQRGEETKVRLGERIGRWKKEITRESGLQAFMALREEARRSGIQDMSLEEINAEINQTRQNMEVHE